MPSSRWFVPLAFFVLVLPAAFAAGPAPECTSFSGLPGQPGIRVCTQLKAHMKVGRSTKYRVWVEGTREPVEIRLHNSSPTVIRLGGGDDQVVRTSGGRKNEAEVKVKSLRVGSAGIKAHPYSRNVKQEAAQIAAEIAPKLAALQTDFGRKRRALPRPCPPQAVAALLDGTTDALLEILSYPELAAMRDHVRAVVREARDGLAESREGSTSHPVVLAAYRFAQSGSGKNESALDSIARLIDRLLDLAKKNDYVVNLCVTSVPKNGARFDMEPESYAAGAKDVLTAGEIINIYRGRYVYRAKLASGKPIECRPRPGSGNPCRPLDLVDDSRPLLVCDFESGLCSRSADALPERCRGNGQ